MGGLFSRSVVMVDLTSQYSSELKQLEISLAELAARKQGLVVRKRALTRGLILWGMFIWMLLAVVCLYIVEFPNRTHVVARCLKIGPCVAWPLVLFLFSRALESYYSIQLRKCDALLVKLEKSKESKLDELMTKTNFKATQKLLSEFSGKKPPQPQSQQQAGAAGSPAKMQPGQPQQQQQGRAVGPHPSTPAGKHASQTMPASAFKLAQQQHAQQQFMQQRAQQQHQQQQGGPSATPHAARPAAMMAPLPPTDPVGSSRSSLDKILDFILNDGPNNKYALLCTVCCGHNGLVREQELGKIRFRCAMCGAINGPPLPMQPQQQASMMPQGLMSPPPASGGVPFTPGPHSGASSSSAPPLTPFAPLSAMRERRATAGDARERSGLLSPEVDHDEEHEEEDELSSVAGQGSRSTRGSRRGSRAGSRAASDAEGEGEDGEAEGQDQDQSARRRKNAPRS